MFKGPFSLWSYLAGILTLLVVVIFLVGAGLDDNVKRSVVNTFTNIENPIKVVPGNKAMQTYELPEDPSLDAGYFGSGPTEGYVLRESSESPYNTQQFMQKAYLYTNGDKTFLFVLTVQPIVVLDESWAMWSSTSISHVSWVGADTLIFIADTKACQVTVSTKETQCK